MYRKDNQMKYIMENVKHNVKTTTFIIDNKSTTFFDSSDEKLMYDEILDEEDERFSLMFDIVSTENFGDKFNNAITTFIKTEKVDGTECYVIVSHGQYINHMINADTDKEEFYISKETGLPVKIMEYAGESVRTTNCKYEFGIVTDEEFVLPDRTGYMIEDAEGED